MFKYLLKKEIYKTATSTIYKHKDSIIKKTSKNEYNVIKNLNHKNLMKLQDYYKDGENNFIVMKNYPFGDLHYNLYNKIINKYSYDNLLYDIINPISYLHSNSIVHMDIKPENYLVNYDKNNNIELILFDFNLSKFHTSNYYDLKPLLNPVGTNHFVAPEVLEYQYSKSSDIYSLGSMLYLIYTNQLYSGKINSSLLEKKPFYVKNIIHDCLKINSKDRPSIFDLKYYYLN